MLIRKIKGISAVFFICIVFTVVSFHLQYKLPSISTSAKEVTYILDAGHGIPDGGAVATDGTAEQELNLAITLKLSKKLDERKIPHILTRADENSVFTEGKTIHSKKVSDIKHRVEMVSKYPNAPVISIHLNTYPDPSVCGIQAFYSETNKESKELAQRLQAAFNEQIQANNEKVIKPISKNIYLFSHISNPSVLIESGFMSNEEELQKLKTDEYQEFLAEVIASVLAG